MCFAVPCSAYRSHAQATRWLPATRKIAAYDGVWLKQLDYKTIREMFHALSRDAEAEPKGELEHVNVYTLVVAVALSAQATEQGVNKATRGLFKIADTPQKMLDLGLEGVTEHIKTIGLFRQKAKNVMKMSQMLVDEFDGEVPNSRAALQSLPGVGRKTANVVLNMWWGQPAQAVDTHIFRVGNRSWHRPLARMWTRWNAPSKIMFLPIFSYTPITG